jgi:hypothetical protein
MTRWTKVWTVRSVCGERTRNHRFSVLGANTASSTLASADGTVRANQKPRSVSDYNA